MLKLRLTVSIIVILLALSSQSMAQVETGLSANIGTSTIRNSLFEKNSGIALSGEAGLFLNIPLSNHFFVRTGSNISFIQDVIKRSETLVGQSGQEIGYSKGKIITYISYINVPINFGVSLKKIQFSLGLQAGIAIFSGAKDSASGEINGQPFSYDNSYDFLVVDKFDYGPRLSFSYDISDKFAIQGFYYHSLMDISKDDFPQTWEIRQLNIGVLYALSFYN